jgi:hypothetical protein
MGRKSRNNKCRNRDVCEDMEMERGGKAKGAIPHLLFGIRKYLPLFGMFPSNSILGNHPIIFLWFLFGCCWDGLFYSSFAYAKDNGEESN